MTQLDLQAIMDQLQRAFQSERATGINASIQFHITGEQGGDWYATIQDKKLTLNQGTVASPKLTITANSADLFNVFTGKVAPMQAYMSGKIQARGDLGLGMRLTDLFRPLS